MAPRSNVVSDMSCRKCSKEVKIFISCGKCDSKYHPSCVLKICGTFVNSEGVVICCENRKDCKCEVKDREIEELKLRISGINESLFEKSLALDRNGSDVVELNGICDSKNEQSIIMYGNESKFDYQEMLIKQKDMLISEMSDKNEILKKHVLLLEKFQNMESPSIENPKQPERKINNNINTVNKSNNACGNAGDPYSNCDNNELDKDDSNMTSPRTCESQESYKWQQVKHRANGNNNKGRKSFTGVFPVQSVQKSSSVRDVNKKSRPEIVKGTGKSDGEVQEFCSSRPKIWLHVGRVSPNTTEESIMKHLNRTFPNRPFTVEAQPTNANSESISFKVGGDVDLQEDLYKSHNWPEGVTIRRFTFFRKRNYYK